MFRRLAYMVRQSRNDAELREEMEAHRQLRAAHLRREGLTPEDAVQASRRALGNVLLAREDAREVWLGSWAAWSQDIRFGLRTLRINPAFTVAAVLTLALGIGVNAGIFTVINGLALRGLSAPDENTLVSIAQTVTGGEGVSTTGAGTFSTSEYHAYRQRTQALSGVLAYGRAPETTLGGRVPQVILGAVVSCNYFDVLRQPPALGRGLVPQDCAPGASPVVILTDDLWRTRFSADRAVVGRTIILNRQPFAIVGVAAEGTYTGAPFGARIAGYIAPFTAEPLLRPGQARYADDNQRWLSLLGRRRDGVSLDQVRADLSLIAVQMDQQQPRRRTTLTVERPTAVPSEMRGMTAAAAAVLMGAFACILLMACANVANLVLARGTARAQEIAIRMSIGASRGRVVRQLVAESLLVAVAAGLVGSLAAVWSFQWLLAAAVPALIPPGLPFHFALNLSPDMRVVSFVVLLTMVTGLLFGLGPAIHVTNPDLDTALKQQTTDAGGGRRGGRLRGVLVGVQVALCMTLTIAAGLLVRALYVTYTVDPGFQFRDVAFVSLESAFAGADRDTPDVLRERLTTVIEALPGVAGFAFTDQEPLGDDSAGMAIRLPGEQKNHVRRAEMQAVTPAYFEVLELPIVRGRTFTIAEMADAPSMFRPAIISEATARNLWPDGDPLGKTLLWEDTTLHVVGVAADAQVGTIGAIDPYYVYLPGSGPVLLVKSRIDLDVMASNISGAIRLLDPDLVVPVFPLEATLSWWRGISRTVATLGVGLGALALVLASVGIYGVVTYAVTTRYREIGIRIALGACTRDVLAMVLRQTMRPVVIGAVMGTAVAAALSRVLTVALFGVSPADPMALGGGALLVVTVALASALLAARPATRADLWATLREN
jgi:predicted permease